ncbi:hypothetical protein DRO59_05335 [Candidatus Bathyarchaeota archaeon]|nr:MAG: hypothetical protein DRO59_05335 [Candidatus Bathyarchaeota archaeon]
MLKNFRDKIALSGIAVLMIGVALLIFTFISAYGFLTQSLSIVASEDLVRTFGDALAPLIATCIRIMYLGVMGWIGSLLTIRGVTIIAHTPQAPKVAPQRPVTIKQKQAPPQKAKAEKPKEMKPPAPQIIVIPPEQNATLQTTPTEKQQKNSSRQSSAS